MDDNAENTALTEEGAALPTALIVDDSRTGRRIIQTLLTFLGFEVVEATTIEEAMAAVARQCFSVITVDRVLDREDGVDLVARLRASPHCEAGVRIIALTGHVGAEHINAFFDAGVDAYLTKPFNVRELAEILASFGFALNDEHVQKQAA